MQRLANHGVGPGSPALKRGIKGSAYSPLLATGIPSVC